MGPKPGITKRQEDIRLKLGPFEYEGTAKALTQLLTGTVGMICLIAFMIWHHLENEKAIWTQTYIVSHPEAERQHAVERLPKDVQAKIAAQAARGD